MIEVSRASIIAAYELLRTTRPFLGWKLPDCGEIEFSVIKANTHYGDCDGETIRVSRAKHGQLSTLLQTVAHEMIHLYQMHNRKAAPNGGHNADFHKRAARVCRVHGWDAKTF